MDRRGFLKTLGILAAAAALPSAIINDWIKDGYVAYKTFYLDRPLYLTGLSDFRIECCEFIASPIFEGEALLMVDDKSRGAIESCIFKTYSDEYLALKLLDTPPHTTIETKGSVT